MNRQAVVTKSLVPTDPVKFLFALGIGLLMGYAQFSNETVAVIYLLISIFPLYFAFRNDVENVFVSVPFLVYAEIYLRTSGSILPYLYCQYVLIAVFGLLILRKGVVFTIYSRCFVFFLFLFTIVELFNSFKSENINIARSLIMQTLLLFVISIWASSSILSPRLINVLLKHIKIAGLWLCGYILFAHFAGHINYGLESNFDSTNGLAPVQISAYLGLLSILFFLSIVNEVERTILWLNIILFAISSIIMLLSFSRGGLYFIGIIAGLYFIFNAKKMSNYFFLLLLIPVGVLIFYIVTSSTNGLIQERYGSKGASGRDVLVEIGFKIFTQHPATGIGTGNFNTEIIKEHLYGEESGAHDEFIRVMAEHGVLGILTYGLFYIVLFADIIRSKSIKREYAFYFLVLFCLIIVHNGLKIGLQPIILLLAIAIPHSGANAKPKLKTLLHA